MMAEVYLGKVSLNILVHDVINLMHIYNIYIYIYIYIYMCLQDKNNTVLSFYQTFCFTDFSNNIFTGHVKM